MDDLKLALLLNAVSPDVGGVLVRGEKGTAKSTVVRSLAALLPDVNAVTGCRFSCDPAAPDPSCPDGPHEPQAAATRRPARLVELPVGASEDRLTGSLDIERALAEGVKAFEPGLLAAAHRGALYVDEVNLLHDHLVDLLLDAAASGTSYVEREGVSVRHAAKLLLVGTMNPEEGELRPQLLDRFGLTADVTASREPAQRAEVVRRRLAYEADPGTFAAGWAAEEEGLAARIVTAQQRLPRVRLTDSALERIAGVCASFEVDGMRADLVIARAATALAAWRDHDEVSRDDIRQAALLALPHRRRRNPFDAPGIDERELDEALDRAGDDDPDPEPPDPGSGQPQEGEPGRDPGTDPGSDGGQPQDPATGKRESTRGAEQQESGQQGDGPEAEQPEATDQPVGDEPAAAEGSSENNQAAAGSGAAPGQAVPAGPAYRARLLTVPGLGAGAPGRRSRAQTPAGRTTGARRAAGRPGALHLAATLRAAAPHQRPRGRDGNGLVVVRDDLREPVREGRESNLVLFVVDASGSMAARQRMRAVKGAVLSLLLDAYQRRDKVGLITFRGAGAELALPPTSSVEAGAARLEQLPTGGRTPLAAGLERAAEVLRVERLRDSRRRPLLVVVTDGRATSATRSAGPEPVAEAHSAARGLAGTGVASVVVDCEAGPVRLGLAPQLARQLGGVAVRLDELAADSLSGLVRGVTSDARRAA